MTSRERVIKTINHQKPDRVPVDFGATGQTGISAFLIENLRKAFGLTEQPVKIQESFQMLGYIDDDLRKKLGSDVIGLWSNYDLFGNKIEGEKPFKISGDKSFIIWKSFTSKKINNNIYVYPAGNEKARPCAVMPEGGYFFDGIFRSEDFDEDNLTPIEDYKNAFSVLDDNSARLFEEQSKRLYEETEYAIVGNLGGGGLGDVALLPGLTEADPKGIRKIEDWYMAHILYPDYIGAVFEMQTEVMLKNLEIYKQAVGNNIQIIWISGTDFGTQNGEIISPEIFRLLYKPYYKKINDWVHNNTAWKTFYHCCGSIVNLLDDFADMGVDILNPVQLSAKGMDARMLKEKYGDKFVFWGGGVDTQKTLSFRTPSEVYDEVKNRLEILSQNGGYVFSAIHNIVANTPVENIMAMISAVKDFNDEYEKNS